MESIIAEPRTVVGKAVKSLRKKGFLPAVVYGQGKETVSVSIPQADFMKVWRSAGESTLVSLQLDTKNTNVLIHDVALDPIKNLPIHVDFYLVDMAHEVEVDVPIEFIGEEAAGKEGGGILVKILHELKVRALPDKLPHSIIVDVAVLKNPKDFVDVKSIKIPAGVTILNNVEDMVAMIEEVRVQAEEPAEEATSAADAIKNIEVVKEKKPQEEAETEEK